MSIDIDRLRKQYTQDDNKAMRQNEKMQMEDIDRYISRLKRRQARVPFRI